PSAVTVARGDCAGAAMDGVWLTYRELADRLGTSAEGARRRAQRGRWTRQRGNDGLARIMVPNDALDAPRPVRAEDRQRADLNAAPARQPAAHAQATIDALREHVETLKAGIEKLEARLADEKERTDHALAAADIRASETVAKHETLLAVERARADGAIAAFE